MAEIAVRPFEDRDLPPVLETMRLALGETAILKRTSDLFAWKHFLNPFGRSIILVAESEGVIAGLRAFMRWELVTPGGETLRCVRAVDTATHPGFQRRGIFRKLTLSALDAARDDNVDLVFNTPNPKSGAGYRSMGWVDVGKIGVMVRPSLGFLRRTTTPGGVPKPTEFLTDPHPARDLSVVDREARGFRTRRTSRYLKWRFEQHPTARYFGIEKDRSVAVVRPNVRSGRKELVLSDVFGPDPSSAIRAAAAVSGAAYMAGWFSFGSREYWAALRAGLLPVPGVTALTMVGYPLRPLEVQGLDRWDLALSDLELL